MNDERDDRLRDLMGELREDFRAPPELRRNVMERVREIPDPAWKRAVDWILKPRTIQVTPATAGLAFAGLALLFVLRPGSDATRPSAPWPRAAPRWPRPRAGDGRVGDPLRVRGSRRLVGTHDR
jgi:hypothetical protein